MSSPGHDALLRQLEGKFPETAAGTAENIETWLSGSVPLVPGSLSEFLAGAPVDLVHDSFWRRLPFGTGGVRGRVGFGPNRLNPSAIALTVQAHCNFLQEHFGEAGSLVVVANDVRQFHDVSQTFKFMGENPFGGVSSRSLAYLAAEVYVANGYRVMMTDPDDDGAVLTTPELSFLIRHLAAVGGVNLSASHNPPDDNGIKVYNEHGGQYLPPFDQQLTDKASAVEHVKRGVFDEALAGGRVSPVPEEAIEAYRQLYMERAARDGLGSLRATPIVFTPLAGCGGRTVEVILDRLGYDVRVPPGQGPDGTFSAIPLLAPNPEVPESTEPARTWAATQGVRTVFAADPDADRFGIDVRRPDGAWVHMTGNQIGTVLAYYLLLDENGPRLQGPVYQTIVTSLAIAEIARRAGIDWVVDDLLVGFKYVAQAIQAREASQPGADDDELLSFAAEESHGYLATSRIRDKDAVSAAVYLAALEERLMGEGSSLLDYLAAVSDEVGHFGDIGRSILMRGSAGIAQIATAISSLRSEPPGEVAGHRVREVVDHWDTERFGPFTSNTDMEARNVVVLVFERGRVTFRPSGTEPKLKFYVQTTPPSREDDDHRPAQELADALGLSLYNEVLGRLGLRLSEGALRLPDVLGLDDKLNFDEVVVPRLLESFEAGAEDEFVLRLLDELLSVMIPGGGRLAIARPALEVAARAAGGLAPERLARVMDLAAASGSRD